MINDEFYINLKKKDRVDSFCDNDNRIVKEALQMTSINFVLFILQNKHIDWGNDSLHN